MAHMMFLLGSSTVKRWHVLQRNPPEEEKSPSLVLFKASPDDVEEILQR